VGDGGKKGGGREAEREQVTVEGERDGKEQRLWVACRGVRTG
jgi:hypothetical protein